MRKDAPVKSPFSELYRLHLELERVAGALRERNRKGWRPLRKHVVNLYEISTKLKVLDKNSRAKFDSLG